MAERILIVDDDIDSLKLIGLMLQRSGYEVIAANTGNQALSKAQSDVPDLIILDIMMPDMNGYDVCRRLRANPKTQEIPIIMFTAKTLIDDKVAGFEAGADDYLTKPTHPAELASRVKAILARSAAQQKQEAPKGSKIGVMSAKGGVGVTTISLNIGAALLQSGENPAIADFRLGKGSMGLFLGMARSQGMAHILSMPPDEIRPTTVEKALVRHQSGLRGLLSSMHPQEALMNFSTEAALATVRSLGAISRPTIFDLGSGYSPVVSELQREMDQLILLVEPNRVSLEMTRELIDELSDDGGGRINVVVVNRAQSSLQTPWQEVENFLGFEIRAIISAAPELAFQAMEANAPMVLVQPNAIVSSQIIKLADEINNRGRPYAGQSPR
jgi:CheY-like chemotaxis protein/MinD-like ATPase involved in chromosome partitioning or flagellar assembly